MARQKNKKKKSSEGADFPFIAEIKYRLKKHREAKHGAQEFIAEDDPLAAEKKATAYLDHEKHGAD
jgi:hypothetical protein